MERWQRFMPASRGVQSLPCGEPLKKFPEFAGAIARAWQTEGWERYVRLGVLVKARGDSLLDVEWGL